MLKKSLCVLLLFSCSSATMATVGQKYYENIFALSVFLSNSEAITFGFANFDPKSFNPNDGDDYDEAVKLRNSLNVINIPYNLALPVAEDNHSYFDELNFAFSYVEQSQKQDFGYEFEDDNSDQILNGFFAFSRNWRLSDDWTFRTRLGSHFMHHRNRHEYNSDESKAYSGELDGSYFNVNSNAFLLEPNLRFSYAQQKSWGKWSFASDYSYFYGWTFSSPSIARGANPEGWEVTNVLKLHYRLYQGSLHAESLFAKAQRVDIGGDIKPSIGTRYYYEFGLGLLLDTSKLTELIDNVGIGLNLNIGSNLNGGSVVLYFNEG